jgi:arylsulfatase A
VASPPELVAKYPNYSPKDAEYLANIENLDLAVGKLLTQLKANNQFDNTLVIFSSDNGSYRQASNGALKAKKSYVYEGGIRVPGIVSWPSQLQGGHTIEEAAGFVDVFPTLAEITSTEIKSKERLDGTSIWPLLKGENFKRKKPLYWFFYRTTPEMAVRNGNKVVLGFSDDTLLLSHQFVSSDMEYIKSMQFARYELYDLEEDISQQTDIFQKDKEAKNFQADIEQQLSEIQSRGHYWEELPPDKPAKQKKQKKDWVKLN